MKRKDLFAIFLTLTTLLSCAEQADNTIVLDSVDDLAGLRVSCSTGSYYEHQLSARKDIDLFIVNTEADGMQALRENMADVFVTDEIMLTEASMRELGVKKAMRGEESFDVAFAVRKGNTDLLKQLNAFLSGPEIKDVVAYWTEGAEDVRPAIPEISPGGKPLRCIAAVNLEPTSYVGDGGEWVGMDPDLLRRFAAFAGRPFEMKFQDIGSAIIALQTGQVDVVSACLFVTEERKKSVDFTIPYYHCHPGYFVKDRGNAHRDGFQERLQRNLVTESRWKLITGGLAKTLEITLFAILLGTVLGALVCAAKRSRRKWLRRLADLYGAFIEGIPTLVLLLIMFYVVFAGSGVNATAVAIVTFACTFFRPARTDGSRPEPGLHAAEDIHGHCAAASYAKRPAIVYRRVRFPAQGDLHCGLHRHPGPYAGQRPHPQPHLRRPHSAGCGDHPVFCHCLGCPLRVQPVPKKETT